MTSLLDSRSTAIPRSPTGAVVSISDNHAAIATLADDGHVRTCEIDRGWWTEARFVSKVVQMIGDRDHVAIIGPATPRLALEREYTAEFRHPDHLLDLEHPKTVDLGELVERVRAFASDPTPPITGG